MRCCDLCIRDHETRCKCCRKAPISLDDLAFKVIRGEYGDGKTRKRLLGDLYLPVQTRVNKILDRY